MRTVVQVSARDVDIEQWDIQPRADDAKTVSGARWVSQACRCTPSPRTVTSRPVIVSGHQRVVCGARTTIAPKQLRNRANVTSRRLSQAGRFLGNWTRAASRFRAELLPANWRDGTK